MSDEDLKKKYEMLLGELKQFIEGYVDFMQRDVSGFHDELLEALDHEKKYQGQIMEKYIEAIYAAREASVASPRSEVYDHFSNIIKSCQMKPEYSKRVTDGMREILREIGTKLNSDQADGGKETKGNVIHLDFKTGERIR